jgi:hypothetical protein
MPPRGRAGEARLRRAALRGAELSFAYVVAPILIWIIVIMAALAFGGLLFRAIDL